MKLKRFPQKLLRKRRRERLPQRASLSLQIHCLQYRLLLVFIPHRKALALVTHVTKPPRAQMLSGPKSPIAVSVEDNIRPSHIPSRPDAAPAPRSGGSLRCPTSANNLECIGCARLRSPGRTPARCRLVPTRHTPCRPQLR